MSLSTVGYPLTLRRRAARAPKQPTDTNNNPTDTSPPTISTQHTYNQQALLLSVSGFLAAAALAAVIIFKGDALTTEVRPSVPCLHMYVLYPRRTVDQILPR